MKFTELPLEIKIIIIQKLDTPSICNMYYTCRHLRNVVTMQGVVKKCCFSTNTLAAVNTFRTKFFIDIASQLQELNLSGSPDVRKTILISGMSKLKNLHTLNISYTSLSINDFLAIYRVCPTIVDITLNFMIKRTGIAKLSDEAILECQNAFKNCKNIHLVGSATNLLYGKLSLLLLQEANLDTLKFSIAESDRLHTVYVPQKAGQAPMVIFKQFFLYFLDWTTVYAFFGSFFMLPVLAMVDLETIEVIIIIRQNLKKYNIHSTPLFNKYFQDTFNVETEKVYISEYSDAIIGNAAILIWDKESQTFDEDFFRQLTKKLKPFFPWECCQNGDVPVPKNYDWFYITPTVPDAKLEKTYRGHGMSKRKAPPDVALHYDNLFESKEKLQLSIICDEYIMNPVTLTPQSNYLEKLTFLSLTGSVRYTPDFFKVLFRCCLNLVTLNVEAPAISPCYQPISNHIHHSVALKNLRLLDRRIDFKLLFLSLSKCPSLESVYLIEDSSAEDTNIANPEILIEACPNLYNLHIQAHMTDAACARKEKVMKKAKKKYNKLFLNLTLHVRADINRKFYSYDPYISAFNLNPIKLKN